MVVGQSAIQAQYTGTLRQPRPRPAHRHCMGRTPESLALAPPIPPNSEDGALGLGTRNCVHFDRVTAFTEHYALTDWVTLRSIR
jgi:hypothetical protein